MRNVLRSVLTIVLTAAVSLGSAGAAIPPPPPPIALFGGSVNLAVTNASGNVALPAALTSFPAVQIRNIGINTVYVTSGTSSVTATTSGIPVLPGDSLTIWVSNTANTYIAGITASGTSSLMIYQWNGLASSTVSALGVAPLPSLPSVTTWQASMTLTANTSMTLTSGNVTINSAGGSLPSTFQKLVVVNSGNNPVYVCWFGGTCSASAGGELLVAGASDAVNLNNFATPPTLFSVLGTTLSLRN